MGHYRYAWLAHICTRACVCAWGIQLGNQTHTYICMLIPGGRWHPILITQKTAVKCLRCYGNAGISTRTHTQILTSSRECKWPAAQEWSQCSCGCFFSWKQQGSGEKVRQVFRNLLERFLAMTEYIASAQRPFPRYKVSALMKTLYLADMSSIIFLEGDQGSKRKCHHITLNFSFVGSRFYRHTAAGEWRQNHRARVTATERGAESAFVSICAFSCLLRAYFMCSCALRCTRTHSLLTVISLFINSLGCKILLQRVQGSVRSCAVPQCK